MKYARVHRWIGKEDVRVYHFGNEDVNGVPLYIFEDDTIERVINKIAVGIHQYHISRGEESFVPSLQVKPYLWTPKRGSLRFERKTESDVALPINPWDSHGTNEPNDLRIVFQEQQFVGDVIQDLHVVFASDIITQWSSLPKLFFPDATARWKAPSFESLIAEDKLVVQAWELGEALHKSPKHVVVTKATFETKTKYKPDLPQLFQHISTSNKIPFIQLVEDEHKVLYKMHKKHTIRMDQLEFWTSWERVPKVASLIVMIATNIPGIFSRLVLDAEGGVHLSYHLESRENIKVEDVLSHKQTAESWIGRYIPKVKLQPTLTSVKVEVPAQNISLPTLSKHLSKYVSVFHVHRVQDGALEVSCKRSKNFQQKLDIADYIASRIHVGTPIPEIMSDLIDLGLSREDVSFWLAQYQLSTEADAPRKKTLSSTGCMMRIAKFATGFRIYIEQAASFAEVERIYQWIYGSVDALKKVPKVAVPQPTESVDQIAQTQRESKSKSKSKSESPVREEPENILNDDSFELSGGALGKTYQRYFSTELKKADPEIFKDAKKYSRQCGATSLRQPVVISVKEKEALDKSPYAASYDDAVAYGSDENHKNYYMCPRIWCPLSRIPLTEEQLQANEGKCPAPHFEEPIVLYQDKYWGKTSQKPHYVGFMDNRSPKGFCLPCCFTSKMKPEKARQCEVPTTAAAATAANAPTEEGTTTSMTSREGDGVRTMADETYIMGAPPPIDSNRFGSIPKSLHHVFMPTVAYATCSKTISTTACYVRRGVGIEDDSFMRSIAIAMGLENKAGLIQYIQNKLDPLTFLSLENGHVLQAFADLDAIVLPQKELVNEWKKWVQKHSQYCNAIGVNIRDLDHMDKYVLSRELGIYKAYRNFMQHLRSNDPKNPQHLMDFFLRQGILFILWKRQGNQASMLCPYFRDVKALLKAEHKLEHAIMLLQDGNYFEPIELKKRSTRGIGLHPLENIPKVVGLTQGSCPAPIFDDTSVDILQKLHTLSAWSSLALQNPNQFRFRSVVVRSDMTLYGIMTYSNAMILLPRSCPIAILPDLFRSLEVKELLYQEDIVGASYSIKNVLTSDIQGFLIKLQQIGFGFHFGTPLSSGSSYILDANLTIPKVAPTILPVIKTSAHDALRESWKRQEKISTKWKQWQMVVGKTLTTYYDTLVVPLLSRPRAKQISTLLQTFPGITKKEENRAKLQQVFEEMPYAEGKEALEKWMRAIQYHRRYLPYINASIHYGAKEIMFSQAAVDQGIPWAKFMSTSAPVANDGKQPMESLIVVPEENASRSVVRGHAKPCMIEKEKIQEVALPSKFKGYSLAKYKIWKHKDACEAIIDFVSWLMKEMEQERNNMSSTRVITMEDIGYIKTMMVSKLLKEEKTAEVLAEDPSYLLAWGEVMKKKYKKPVDLWARSLKEMTYENRRAIWLENVATSSLLKWNDLDWSIFAQLMGINVFMIHRAKHGGTEQMGEKYVRGNIADLSLSSYFLASGTDWKLMPCVFLYKEYTDTYTDYHVVVDEKETIIHPVTKKLPKDILELMELHMSRR